MLEPEDIELRNSGLTDPDSSELDVFALQDLLPIELEGPTLPDKELPGLPARLLPEKPPKPKEHDFTSMLWPEEEPRLFQELAEELQP